MESVLVPDREAEAAIVRLMTAYGDHILRVCFVMLRDSFMAEEAMQDTFLKAYRAWKSFKRECSEKTWLNRIAVNTCRDMRRRVWFRLKTMEVSLNSVPEPAADFEEKDDTLLKAVMGLPYKYREAISLHYYQGLSPEETAQALRISRSGVYSRLKRAEEMLRKELEGWYHET